MGFNWSEEQNAVLSATGNMLVSASAGSGKTTLMIERVLRLLKGGADIRRILLMTFSRASASEMADKLVEKLYGGIREGGEDASKLKEQLDNVPFANVGTIDSFCYKLMQKYFNAIGCDPAATISDETQTAIALDECCEKTIEDYIEKNDEDFALLAKFFRSNRNYDALKNTLIAVYRQSCNAPDREDFLDICASSDMSVLEERYLDYKKKDVARIKNAAKNATLYAAEENYSDASVNAAREADLVCEECLQAEKVANFFSAAGRLAKPRNIDVRKINEGKVSQELADRIRLVVNLIGQFVTKTEKDRARYENHTDAVQIASIKKAIVKVVRSFAAEYEAYKKRRNTIDFADAVRNALKILENDEVRQEVRASFDYIFVDEYQDTNYLQEALINAISSGNNVFTVGDVKQAIYHFRSAEPQIFINRMSEYDLSGSGKNFTLNTNYRSSKEILDFTNRVCAAIMVKEACGIDYRNTAMLNYGDKVRTEDGEPPVRIITYETEKDKEISKGIYRVKTAEKAREDEFESEFIAREIERLVSEGKYAYEDFAVIGRSNKTVRAINDKLLERGIPSYFRGKSEGVSPEKYVLVDALRVALNADEDAPLYNFLQSPICGFGNAKLLKIRSTPVENVTNPSLWVSVFNYKGDASTENKILRTRELLEKTRLGCLYKRASEVMEDLLATGMDAYLLSLGEEKIAEINAFVSYVSSLPCDRKVSEFIKYFDDAYEGNPLPAKKSAVTLMTMHAGKGLEFPVVFIPKASKNASGGGDTAPIKLDSELGLAVRHYSDDEYAAEDSFASVVFKLKEADEERKEEARLMYVAFTRAKKKLYVIGEKTEPAGSVFSPASIMQRILYAAERDDKLAELFENGVLPERKETPEKVYVPKRFDFNKLRGKYAFAEETITPVKYSVSEILSKEEGYGENPFVSTSSDGKEAAKLGTAIHLVMQKIDYSVRSEEEVGEFVNALVAQGYLTKEEGKLVPKDKIVEVLSSPIMQSFARYETKREQPFVMYVSVGEGKAKCLVQGVIDLLVKTEEGYVVVDFKTGRASGETMKKRYEKQLNLYAEGVEKIYKTPVLKKVIINIINGSVVDF